MNGIGQHDARGHRRLAIHRRLLIEERLLELRKIV